MTKWQMSNQVDLVRVPPGSSGPAIDVGQSRRQMQTAKELVTRLRSRPGQVLADEVGLGKTYTALAVAASVALENPGAGPVVVMVPPALTHKWPREWDVFAERYVKGVPPRHKSANRGVEFLRLIDDPPETRAQIIFLRSGAFGTQLGDAWVKLAIVRHALIRRRNVDRERRAVDRWGAKLVGARDPRLERDGLVPALLDAPYSRWKAVGNRYGARLDDDPIPAGLTKTIQRLDLTAVRDALSRLPTNRSKYSDDKVRSVSRAIDSAIKVLWQDWLASVQFQAPLLILDEAHHAKNPGAQLSQLFANERAAGGESPGTLYGRFDRMLFLTATPFQLGHHELLQVLSRFGGVNWDTLPGDRTAFEAEIKALGGKLGAAQRTMATLDRAWGQLRHEDVDELPEGWWGHDPALGELADRPARARRAFREGTRARDRAQSDLQRWVIRHRKPDSYPSGDPRRCYVRGAQIDGGSEHDGLDVDRGTLLPFLLAARAQVAFRTAQSSGEVPKRAQALFADGICSSYEAYLDTRTGSGTDEDTQQPVATAVNGDVGWYLDAIQRALPADDATARAAHPKIEPVVREVRRLWLAGEKVVVFCHFRATGAALRRHISQAIEAELWRTAADQFGVPEAEVEDTIQRLSRRLERRTDASSPLFRAANAEVEAIASGIHNLEPDQEAKFADVLLRFLRSPVVLARYGAPLHREGDRGLAAMLDRDDVGGVPLRVRLRTFASYVDGFVASQRRELLTALDRIQTSNSHAEVSDLADEGENQTERLLATVRLANGAVKQDTRRRLMLAFNSPLLPEVLVASQVLAEGVDLHHDCRHVIHHDLDWNPSTLEQRTGRVDRLGSLGERLGKPITIALPYIANTQDEKMYRVVRDRERWFQVVMGARHQLDEAEIDDFAKRVELPQSAAEALAFRLECG